MADELRRWLDDLPLAITPPSLARRSANWIRCNQTLSAMFALAFVLAIFAVTAGINANLRQREGLIAAGAREEMALQNLLVEGREELRLTDQGRTARVQVQMDILPQIAAHRRRLLPDAPIDEIDVQIRSLLAASLGEFDLRLVKGVDMPIALNLIWPAVFHPSGRFAAVGSVDRPCRVGFDDTSALLTGIENREPRSRIAFSPNGRWLAFSPGSGGVELWDGSVERCLAKCDPSNPLLVVTMVFDAPGKNLWICDRHGKLARFNVPELTEVSTGVPRREGLTTVIAAAAFSADLSRVAYGNENGQIFIENLAEGTRQEMATIPKAVDLLAWSPDGATIAVGGRDGLVRVYDVSQNSLIHRLATGSNAVEGLCFSPNGAWLAAGCAGSASSIWNLVSGQLELRLPIIPCAFAADAPYLLGTSQQRLEKYEFASTTSVRRLPGHQASLDQLVWSSNSRFFATIDNQFVVRVWDASGAQSPSRFVLPSAEWYAADAGLAVSDDGKSIVTVHRTGGRSELRISDRNGICRQSWPLPAGYYRLAIRKDGTIISISQESCEFNRDACQTVVREFTLGRVPIERGVLRQSVADEQGFFSHSLSPEGRRYVLIGPRLPRAKTQTEVWDLTSSKLLIRIPQGGERDWGDADAKLAGPDLTLWTVNWNVYSRYEVGRNESPKAISIGPNLFAVSPDGLWSLSADPIRQSRLNFIIAIDSPPHDHAWVKVSSRDQTSAGGLGTAFSPDGR
jgi:WD40 repeat protein